jgi:hypothetical protein
LDKEMVIDTVDADIDVDMNTYVPKRIPDWDYKKSTKLNEENVWTDMHHSREAQKVCFPYMA